MFIATFDEPASALTAAPDPLIKTAPSIVIVESAADTAQTAPLKPLRLPLVSPPSIMLIPPPFDTVIAAPLTLL